MSTGNTFEWLLVPMEVSAMVVGKDAATNDDFAWSDLSPDFSKIWNERVLQGPNLIGLFPQGRQEGDIPEAGIHLHWFLPEAFGRSDGQKYPAVPNRWLVQRVRYTPDTCQVKEVARWIVESDFLHGEENPVPGTITMLRTEQGMLFDSVGRAVPLNNWTESTPRFTLTAIGSGVPYFPSHYPACKSVLGFHDAAPSNGDAHDWQVSYQVCGWSSDVAKDLLQGLDAADLVTKLKELDWTAAPVDSAAHVLCHGAVCRIAWNAADPHSSSVPAAGAAAYLGNSNTEALGALLSLKMSADPASAREQERVLDAFQFNMLERLAQMDDVDAEFHRHCFTTSPGADCYTIQAQQKSSGVDANADPSVRPPAIQRLPLELQSALDSLNEKASQDARSQRELASLQQSLFNAWTLWANAYIAEPIGPKAESPQTVVDQGKQLVASAAAATRVASDMHQQAREALKQTLSTRFADMELVQSTEPPFFRAMDPSILLEGKGLKPSGVMDSYIRSTGLACRWVSQVAAGVSAIVPSALSATVVKAADLFDASLFLGTSITFGAGPASDVFNALLSEMLLLDPVNPNIANPPVPVAELVAEKAVAESPVKPDKEQLAHFQQSIAKALTHPASEVTDSVVIGNQSGVAVLWPDPIALFRWTANPWRPVLMAWEVFWYPQAGLDGSGNIADPVNGWQPWPLNDSGNEFRTPDVPFASQAIPLRSLSMLAPHPEWVLRRRLEKLRSQSKDATADALDHAISKVDGLDVVAQALSGFHDALRQLGQGLQLPTIQPQYVEQDTPPRAPLPQSIRDDVWNSLTTNAMLAPMMNGPLQPVRAGQLQLGRVMLVDSFGQTATPLSINHDLHTSFALSAPAVAAKGPPRVTLPPRYVQPARLDLNWTPADTGNTSSSPLCGWIFPNHLDQSLMVSDATGKLLGAVQSIIRVTTTGSRPKQAFFWVPVPGSENTLVDIVDEHLRGFVRGLTAMSADAGSNLLTAIATMQADTRTGPQQDDRLSLLVGRPLALARASLCMELFGLPAADAGSGVQRKPADAATRAFTKLRFPVRLGGPDGAAGGVAGFLLDGDPTFYPRYGIGGADYPGALVHNRELQLDAENAVAMTLLVDPVQPIYARCGLLPRHSFTLPAAVALGVSFIREVFFQGAPLLCPAGGGPAMPKPSDDYGRWSWAVRPRVTFWQESANLAGANDSVSFGQAPMELQEGWLKLAMNPVNISALWVKEGALSVAPGTRVTLGWTVEGAQSLTLRDKKTNQTLASWSQQPNSALPSEYPLQVTTNVEVLLTATDAQGNLSVRSLQLSTVDGGHQ